MAAAEATTTMTSKMAVAEGNSEPPKLQNRFFVMRHGQSEANAQGLIVCSPDVGCREYGLTDLGRSQVKKACEELKSLLRPLSPSNHLIIVSSDFKRASQTAEIVSHELGNGVESSIRYEPALRERDFGDLHLTSDSNYEKVWKSDIKDPNHTNHGCESVAMVVNRVSRLVQKLDSEFQNKVILLVAHGDPLQIISCVYAGIPPNCHKSLPNLVPAGLRELGQNLNIST